MCRPAYRRPDTASANPPIACLCAPAYDVPPRSVDHAPDTAIVSGWHVDLRRPRRIRTSSTTTLFCYRKPTRPMPDGQSAPVAEPKPGEQARGFQRPQRRLVRSRSIASPRPLKIARLLRPRSLRSWSGSTSIRSRSWPTPASSGPSARDACAPTLSTLCALTCSMAPMRHRTRQATGAPVRSAGFARSRFPSAALLTDRAAP